MILKLTNNLTKNEANIEVIDTEISQKYWNFKLSLPAGMDDGEYSYVLVDGNGDEKASGLLQIGDFVPEKTEYNEKEEYITYDGD